MSEKREPKFTFQCLDGKSFASLENKDNQEYFLKWSMKGRIKAQAFSFDQPFQVYEKDDFVLDFMSDPNVTLKLQQVSADGKWSRVGVPATSVTVESVSCTVLSMTLFDRLYEHHVVREESGYICKCLDEYHGDFIISDELRKLLLIDDSDNYCLYSDSERDEFLFRLFRHVCLGGKFCQFEDKIDPYLDITKQVYKDLISVQKNPETKELNIISSVFCVTAFNDGQQYFPGSEYHENTFAYMIVDPLKRQVTTFFHSFGASQFE